MPSSRVRIPHPRTLVALALVAAAVVTALAGARAPRYAWTRALGGAQDGSRRITLRPEGRVWDGLELRESFPRYHSGSPLCGRDDRGRPLIALSDYTYTLPKRSIRTIVMDAAVDTLLLIDGHWLVTLLTPGASAEDTELLLWSPELSYRPVAHPDRIDPAKLFRHNYSHSLKIIDAGVFDSALAATARGDSAIVHTQLRIVGLNNEERSRFPIPVRYTADSGVLFEADGEKLVLIETDGGYSDADVFYLLFDQPALTDGDVVQITRAGNIEGSYRGLYIVAPDRPDTLWYRQMGLSCLSQHLVDLDRDGVDEIVMETYAAENGVSGSGTTDAGCAYVICIDQGGNILWRKRVTGVYPGTQAAAVDVTGDGDLEVVVIWSSGFHEELGGVAVMDAEGRTLAERRDLGGLYAMCVADFDGDGALEIATGGPAGSVYLLDGDLEIEREMVDSTLLIPLPDGMSQEEAELRYMGTGAPWRRRIMPAAAADVTGDGVPEIVGLATMWCRWDVPKGAILSGRSEIVMLDGDLSPVLRCSVTAARTRIGACPVDMPASMKLEMAALDLDRDGRDELVVGTHGHGMHFFSDGEAP